jgi:drug/metabolite transporter (DMT)-like permease
MTTTAGALRTLLLTGAALSAFAANSLLCRLALEAGRIDPGSFTLVRFASGALVLWVLVAARRGPTRPVWDWISAASLCLYGVAFAYAYMDLGAGTGALILFGAVQISMFFAGLRGGERVGMGAYAGLLLALGGLLGLTVPTLTAPPLGAACLMAVAGSAWGAYSLRGRRASEPLAANAASFALAVPLCLLMLPALPGERWLTPMGLLLAVLAGGVASALGYVAWYAALQGLHATRAAVLQLLVPVLAALGGVAWLGENLSPGLVVSFLAVIGGTLVFLVRSEGSGRHRGLTKGPRSPYRPETSAAQT